MSLVDPNPSFVDTAAPADLVEVGLYLTEREAAAHGLVVLALGRPYWLAASPEGHRLSVEADVAGHMREQLARYERESRDWPPRQIADMATHGVDLITPLLWAIAILVVFHFQGTRPEWTERGALDAAAVFDRGEWWRIATALAFHGDGGHVIANVLSGICLFTAVLTTFGRRSGWVLVTVSALAANLTVAGLAYPAAYRSLGASTAIFAALGLLTGRMLGVLRHADPRRRGRAMFVALSSGLIMFALYGTGGGGPKVDVGAHSGGFAIGLVLGFSVVARKPSTKKAETVGSAQ